MMMDTVSEGRIDFSHRIEIVNPKGDLLETMMFREAVAVEG